MSKYERLVIVTGFIQLALEVKFYIIDKLTA